MKNFENTQFDGSGVADAAEVGAGVPGAFQAGGALREGRPHVAFAADDGAPDLSEDRKLTLARFLDALYVKKGRSYKGLTVFPIFLVAREFRRSDEVFEVLGKMDMGNNIRVKETANLESIGLMNRGKLRAVALDGTVVSGATQRRILGASAVIEPGESVELPVCGLKIEPNGAAFDGDSSRRFAFPIATHRRMIRLESLDQMTKDEPNMKQRRVWSRLRDAFVNSNMGEKPSMDVNDLYRHWGGAIEDYTWRHRVDPLQVGFITFFDKDMWFLDLFLNTRLLEAAFPDLIRGYAFDAVIRRTGIQREVYRERAPEYDDALDLFNYLRCVNYKQMKFNGAPLKDSFYFDTKKACGSVLSNNGQLIHMSAYSKDKPPREY